MSNSAPSLSAKTSFFFFQAEDGIRDRNVTGVQTCALPIYNSLEKAEVQEIAQELQRRGIKCWLDVEDLRPGYKWQPILERQFETIGAAAVFRSEERRVGKECRYRCSREHVKDKREEAGYKE